MLNQPRNATEMRHRDIALMPIDTRELPIVSDYYQPVEDRVKAFVRRLWLLLWVGGVAMILLALFVPAVRS